MDTKPLNAVWPERMLQLHQAMFFNCSGMYSKLPVSIVEPFFIEREKVIWFNINKLPVTDIDDNYFAGELFFFKKGEYFTVVAEGIAEIMYFDSLCIKFTITKLKYTSQAETPVKPSLYSKILPMLKVIPAIGYYGSRINFKRVFHMF